MFIRTMPSLKPRRILLAGRWASCIGSRSEHLQVHYGMRTAKVTPEFSDRISADTLGGPPEFMRPLTFPDKVPFDLRLEGPRLHIGPVIAYLVSNEPLTPARLDQYRDASARLQGQSGLIYICSVQGIRPENKTVRGYAYRPGQAENGKYPWEPGIFPLSRSGLLKSR